MKDKDLIKLNNSFEDYEFMSLRDLLLVEILKQLMRLNNKSLSKQVKKK